MCLAETKGAKTPSCNAPSEEIKTKSSNDTTEAVPPYYHFVAIELYDKFKDEGESLLFDSYMNGIKDFIMDYAVQYLSHLKSLQMASNEYKCSSHLQVVLDRFLFHQRDHLNKRCPFFSISSA